VSLSNCRHCGKETGEGELYCLECQAIAGAKKPKRIWIFSLIFSGLLLSLTGMMLWHGGLNFGNLSLDAIWGKPAAVINGETISRSELKARLANMRKMLERQYDTDVFAGERGRVLLANLEQEVLEGMLEERLVAQEARRLGIQIKDEDVRQEMEGIARKVSGSWEKFEAELQEDGVFKEDLQKHIGNLLLVKAVKSAKGSEGPNSDVVFSNWLVQAKQKAEIAIYDSGKRTQNPNPGGRGCCSPGQSSGGCGVQGGSGGQPDPKTESQAKKIALEAYWKNNPSEQGVTAKVTDYGCHIQVDIQKEGRVVKSYTYQDGKVFDNS